jgi:hypothetical protein
MTKFSFLDYVVIALGVLAVDLATYTGTDAELAAATSGKAGTLLGVYVLNKLDAWFKWWN